MGALSSFFWGWLMMLLMGVAGLAVVGYWPCVLAALGCYVGYELVSSKKAD